MNKFNLPRYKDILIPLQAHLEGGRGNPLSLGQKRPLLHAVFLCQSKMQTALIRFKSDMVALVGNLSRLAVPKHGISTPANAASYDVEIISSGSHPQSLGHTAMNTSSTGENRLNSTQSQNITLFNQLLAEFATLQQSLSNPINQLSHALWARSVALSWQLLEVSENMELQAKGASHV